VLQYRKFYSYSSSICLVPICPSLNTPVNGKINCLLGGDGQANPGDTCTFTCDDGYELSGSASRVCTNSETWDGTNSKCTKGAYFINMLAYALYPIFSAQKLFS